MYPGDAIMSISHESIYMYIYKHRQAKVNKKLIKLLPRYRYKRRNHSSSKPDKKRIKDQISIEQRPASFGLRGQPVSVQEKTTQGKSRININFALFIKHL